jgi:hypothetical protein
MQTLHQPSHRRRRLGVVLHRWHRRMGAVAGVFVLWLAISGIVLNHSADLGLDHKPVSTPWLMQIYGLRTIVPSQGFQSTTHWMVGTDAQTVIDGHPLASALARPLGLVSVGSLLFAANVDSIVLLDAHGVLVDTLHASDLPIPAVRRIGQGDGVVVIADSDGKRFASADGLGWKPYGGKVAWSTIEKLPESIVRAATPYFRPHLPLERILLDAHSGRIAGHYGPLVVDGVGVVFVLIALSGIWLYVRHRLRLAHH